MIRSLVGVIVSALLALICSAAPAAAHRSSVPLEYLPALKGDYFPLASTATGLTYHIYVRYPLGYVDDAADRYPVVYLLDGDSAFPLLAAQHLFLTIDDRLPEAIVVGIAYGGFDSKVNKRDVDYGPRAEAFHRFLETELIPQVESKVRADAQRRVLVGQSYGGSFVLWSALNRPDTFWGRIASNPSFRLHGPKLWEAAAAPKREGLRLFVVSGTGNDAGARAKAIEWTDQWRTRKSGLTAERIDIVGGTHAANFPDAYRAGMRQLFDWKPVSSDPH